MSFCSKGPGLGKAERGPIGGATPGVPTPPLATYQDPLIGELLQAPVPGGVKDHGEGLVGRLHVAEFHLVLGRETKDYSDLLGVVFQNGLIPPGRGQGGAADPPQDLGVQERPLRTLAKRELCLGPGHLEGSRRDR